MSARPARRLAIALLGLSTTLGGCDLTDDATLRNFRDGAADGLRSGLSAITAGLINGAIDALLTDSDGNIAGDDGTTTETG